MRGALQKSHLFFIERFNGPPKNLVAGWKISRQWIKKSGVDIPFSDCSFVRSIEDLITNGIGCCAVPMFFYFGIFNIKKNEPYKFLIKKKICSLFVPFLLWTFINIFLFVMLNNNLSILKSFSFYD